MATTLHVRGNDIELAEEESFGKVKRRVKTAKQRRLDYELGKVTEFEAGADQLEFYTDLGDGDTGRVYFDTADVFGVSSTERKDGTKDDD